MSSRAHRSFERLLTILLGSASLAAVDVASAAFTIQDIVSPDLGTALAGISGRQFILNTDETVGGADVMDLLFGAVSGQLEFKKTGGPQDANILAENIITSGGVTVNAVPCRYHTGPQLNCRGSGIDVTVQGARTLYLGIDLDTSIEHFGGETVIVTYDITVTFV